MRKLVLRRQDITKYKAMFDLTDEDLHTRIFEYSGETNPLSKSDYQLPFADFNFDFALSSHDLFTQFEKTQSEACIQIIRELARVANEVRIFPVVDALGQVTPLLGPVLLGLQQANYGVEVREVPYTLYPKGNVMLRVWAQVCSV